MDDLVVAMFKRSSERDLQRLDDASGSQRSVSELWRLCHNSHDARLISEYMALVRRVPELRQEAIDFFEVSRRIQVDTIAAGRKYLMIRLALPAAVIATLASSLDLLLNREGDGRQGNNGRHRRLSEGDGAKVTAVCGRRLGRGAVPKIKTVVTAADALQYQDVDVYKEPLKGAFIHVLPFGRSASCA